jgi:Flp pilus assembly protein TadG
MNRFFGKTGMTKSTSHPRNDRGLRMIRRLRSESGSVVVEFALIAPLFLALLVAVIETALVFFSQQVLQTAVTQSARQIMTGQAQTQNMTAGQFQKAVCGNLPTMFNCANLYVNVQEFASFSTVSMLNPLQNGKLSNSNMNYGLGVGGDIEMVQLFYLWPILTAPLGFGLPNINGNYLLVATAVFRNEPF